jgi:hypothetical protein
MTARQICAARQTFAVTGLLLIGFSATNQQVSRMTKLA